MSPRTLQSIDLSSLCVLLSRAYILACTMSIRSAHRTYWCEGGGSVCISFELLTDDKQPASSV